MSANIQKASAIKASKSERIEARVSSDQKQLFQEAADLSGKSLTDYAISCMLEKAKELIREHRVISLSRDDSVNFVTTVLQSKEPNRKLKAAAENYRKLMEQDD